MFAAAGGAGHGVGPHQLPAVRDAARLEGPAEHLAVEVAETGGIRHLVGDVRQRAGASSVDFRALSRDNRSIDRERHTLRIGGVEQHAVVGLAYLARHAACLAYRGARRPHVGDGIAAEQGGPSRVS
jgi:hypothetical protein